MSNYRKHNSDQANIGILLANLIVFGLTLKLRDIQGKGPATMITPDKARELREAIRDGELELGKPISLRMDGTADYPLRRVGHMGVVFMLHRLREGEATLIVEAVNTLVPMADELTFMTERKRELAAECAALHAERDTWMNGVADVVEPLGYDRDVACGPADLLPGLAELRGLLEQLCDGFDRWWQMDEPGTARETVRRTRSYLEKGSK